MNVVRSLISVFLVILFCLAIAGWVWAGSLPAEKMTGARVVLGACCGASILGLFMLWTAKNERRNATP